LRPGGLSEKPSRPAASLPARRDVARAAAPPPEVVSTVPSQDLPFSAHVPAGAPYAPPDALQLLPVALRAHGLCAPPSPASAGFSAGAHVLGRPPATVVSTSPGGAPSMRPQASQAIRLSSRPPDSRCNKKGDASRTRRARRPPEVLMRASRPLPCPWHVRCAQKNRSDVHCLATLAYVGPATLRMQTKNGGLRPPTRLSACSLVTIPRFERPDSFHRPALRS